MNHPSLFRFTFSVLLVMAGLQCFAQKATPTAWKKTVTRTIDLSEKEDSKKHHLKDAGNTTYLAEIMINDITAGKLTAYSNFDVNFSNKLTAAEVKQMFGATKDTVTVQDPVTGREVVKVVTRDVNYEIMQKFRLLEEWTFNPATGKTDIQITGIAPIKEIYGVDGSFRGVQAAFWLHYNDAQPCINRFDQSHPTGTLAMHIWDDYFLSDVKPKDAK